MTATVHFTPVFRRLRVAACLIAAAATMGCAGGQLTNEQKANGAMVYMFLDDAEMQGTLASVSVKKVAAGKEPEYWNFGNRKVEGGRVIYVDGLPPGSWQLNNYSSITGIRVGCVQLCGGTTHVFRFPPQGSGFRIPKKGEAYFLGSYRHLRKKQGFFRAEKFDIKRMETPSEKEVLEMLIPKLESDSPMLPVAQRRLRQLQ